MYRNALQLGSFVMLVGACAGSPTEAATLSSDGTSSATSSDATTMTTQSSTPDETSSATSTTTASTTDPDPSSETATSNSTTETSTSSDDASTGGESSSTGAPDECHPILNEVFNDPQGDDGLLEWVELYNPCDAAIDLAGYSLAWGGDAYADTLELDGEIAASGCFVVGGPMSTSANFSPAFDQAIDFDTDLENTTNGAADGIALFAVPAAEIGVDTVPVDALIYGDANVNGLLDETGEPGVPDVAPGTQGDAYARVDPAIAGKAAMWTVTADSASPGMCPNP